jgi:hypothetical protein
MARRPAPESSRADDAQCKLSLRRSPDRGIAPEEESGVTEGKPPATARVFKSAVDTWFYLAVLGTAAIVTVALAPMFHSGQAVAILLAAAMFALALGLPLWLLASTDYRIEEATLHIRSGPFRWDIPVAEIHSILPSRSFLSSPALSLNRLEIHYGAGRHILVSPADRGGFVRTIEEHRGGPLRRP